MAIVSTVQPLLIPTVRRTPAIGAALGFIHIILALALLAPTILFGFITVAALTGAAVPPLDPFIPALILLGPILLGVLTALFAIEFLLVLALGIGMLRLGGFSRGLAIVTAVFTLVVLGAQIGLTFPLSFFSIFLASFATILVIEFILAVVSAVYLSLQSVRAIYEPGAIGGLAAQALSGALPNLTSLQPTQQLTLLPTGAVPTATITQAGIGPPTLGPFPLPFPPFQSPLVATPVGFAPPIAAYSNPFQQVAQFGFGFPQVLSVYSSQPALADRAFAPATYCNECGQMSNASAAFCDHCGRRLDYR